MDGGAAGVIIIINYSRCIILELGLGAEVLPNEISVIRLVFLAALL
jgi:hypothetical protein